jgi:ubiquinol-cytochrome c reductase iron-sulfur subunit
MAETTVRHGESGGATRRDVLDVVTWSAVAIGAGTMVWPLISSMNPSADVLALSTTEVDVSQVPEGVGITIMWRGRPTFVRHRTAAEIEEARAVPLSELKDPETDEARVKEGKEAFLIVGGNCTHLGCVPLGNKPTDDRGEFGGWFCPCHGSEYDTSGRIRRGPAPLNLPVPEYAFISDTVARIG